MLSGSMASPALVSQCSRFVFCRDDALLEPVTTPHVNHLHNGDILGLWQEEVDERRHDEHPSSEEEENVVLEVAQNGQECLCDDEGEDQVGSNGDTLAS